MKIIIHPTYFPNIFSFKTIILKCDKNFQKGEKRFRGFVSSEYVWAYRNSGKFINLLFGYKTTKDGFKIEVLEKDIKMKYARYYRFHDKKNTDPNKILSNSITGHKLRSNKKWYSCKLTIPKSNDITFLVDDKSMTDMVFDLIRQKSCQNLCFCFLASDLVDLKGRGDHQWLAPTRAFYVFSV